jgi:hypothetical protein
VTVFVADALKWYVPEELGDAAERLIASGHAIQVPRFLAVETFNAAWKN